MKLPRTLPQAVALGPGHVWINPKDELEARLSGTSHGRKAQQLMSAAGDIGGQRLYGAGAPLPPLSNPMPLSTQELPVEMQAGGAVDESEKPYEILSPTKIKLNAAAKFWAEQYGMSLTEFAKYLLQADKLRDSGIEVTAEEEPSEAQVTVTDILPHTVPSQNIEDRRDEPHYADPTLAKIWGDVSPVLQAQAYGPNPLANALGFRNVGQPAPPIPQVFAPTAPQWPTAFGNYNPYKHPFD